MKLLIDPGHGGNDPGAVAADGTREADIVLSVGHILREVSCGLNDTPAMTRTNDRYISLGERCAIEHNIQPDCFISLHTNAALSHSARGIEVWTFPGQTDADPLADCIYTQLHACFPDVTFRSDLADGDFDKEGRLYVLRGTRAPAVLVEMGFISNTEECEWLKLLSTQKLIALGIAAGTEMWGAQK